MEPERVTARQIEAARRALTRHMKRAGRVWIRIFPDVPVSKKPIEVRMGKGKGNPEYYVAVVRPGTILFELAGGSLLTRFENNELDVAGVSVNDIDRVRDQNNPLILGPGGFRFGDYWRLGLPVQLVVGAVSIPMLLLVWPL